MSQDPHRMPAGVEEPPGGNAGEKITPSFYRFFSRYLSRVELAPEYERTLQGLSERGVVVYALKYRSRLNGLILHELGLRKNIPQPLYFHGTKSPLWRKATKHRPLPAGKPSGRSGVHGGPRPPHPPPGELRDLSSRLGAR